MKKKIIACFLALTMLFQSNLVFADELMDITHEAGYPEALEMNRPKSSIVIDGKTGDVIWGDNIDAPRDPASMSKVMALYLIFEAMAEGKFSPDTVVTATENDEAMAKIWEISNNNIVAGVDYTVAELIVATIVPSSNTATLMLANLVEPDPDVFIDMMNAKAKELGMNNTVFHNGTGAVARAFQGYYAPQRHDIYATNETTARDFAILTYNFVNNYPTILDYTGESNPKIKEGTPYEETFKSYNYSLPDSKYGIEGVTGFKTGSSPSAAFNITATAKRGEQEVIAVIMGVGDWVDQDGEYYRHPFTNALIEKAFKEYDYQLIADAGRQNISGQTVTLKAPIYGTVASGTAGELVYANGSIQVNNGLEKVSPLVAQKLAVAAEENNFLGLGASNSNQSTAKAPANLWSLLGGITLLVLLLGFAVYKLEVRNRRRRLRKH